MNGFLVENRVRAVILSYKSSNGLKTYLNNRNIDIIETLPIRIDKRIADHADLQIHPINQEIFIASPSSYSYYRKKLSKYGKIVIEGNNEPAYQYPQDTIYNVSKAGEYYIANIEAIDDKIHEVYRQLGCKLLKVKQGYAKCMTIPLKRAIITCDRGIDKALKDRKIKSYYLDTEDIILDGFNKGFIGGSCGFIDKNTLLFTGDISKTDIYDELKLIGEKEDFHIVYPKDEKIIDLGSIIPLE